MLALRPLLVSLALLVSSPFALSDTVYVDATAVSGGDGSQLSPYDTIQEGIDAAVAGDTVLIAAGTYAETLTCNKAITLRGTDGAASTLVDGSNSGRVLSASSFSGTLIVEGLTLQNGQRSSGAGASLASCAVEMRGCRLVSNWANAPENADGGAIHAINVALTLTDCTLSQNLGTGSFASGRGGAVYASGGSLTVSGCEISSNQAATQGGGIYAISASVQISESEIANNQCNGSIGGGIMLDGLTGAVIERCRLTGNDGNDGGGGIGFQGASATIENCLIAGNTKESGKIYGAGIGLRNTSSATVRYCTVADNPGGASGAGITVQSGSTLTMVNSIAWGNSPAEISSAGTADVTYSTVQGGFSGTGNLSGDPLFVDTTQLDYRLGTGSPCIDAGTSVTDPPSLDLEGDDRVVDGDSDETATSDMGCDEYDLLFRLDGQRATGQTVHFDAMAPPAFEGHWAQVLFSLSNGAESGGLLVPNTGGQKIRLDVDAVFNEMMALSAYFRVQLDANGSGSTSSVVIPANAPVGTTIYFAGISWDPDLANSFDWTPTQEIVLQ